MPSVSFNSIYARNAYPAGIVPDVRSDELDVGRQHERADHDRRPAARRRSRARKPSWSSRVRSGSRSRSWPRSTRARRGRSWWRRARRGKRRPARFSRRSGRIEIANVRFTNGVSTQLELSDARLSLQLAEANRTQAARDLQVARARVALLPNLPVGTERRIRVRLRRRQPQCRAAAPAPSQPQGGEPDQERVRAGSTGTGRDSMRTGRNSNQDANSSIVTHLCLHRSSHLLTRAVERKRRSVKKRRRSSRSVRRTSCRSRRAPSWSDRSSRAS